MGKRIIVIDDSREVGRVILAGLKTLPDDLEVQVFISAEEALLEATRSPVHLLVSDLLLPGKSGIELVKAMRQRRPEVRVILITGVTDQVLIKQAKAIDSDGFFQKPVNMTAFLDAVKISLAKVDVGKADTAPLSEKPPVVERRRRGTGVLRAPTEEASNRARRGSAPTRLSEAITTLRQRLGAQAVFILDERGRVVELAGDLPAGDFEQDWAPKVMGALSASQKAARLVGETQSPLVIALQGQNYHMALAPLEQYALTLLLKPGRASLRLGLAVEEALLAQTTLLEMLGNLGVTQAQALPEALPAIEIPVAFAEPSPVIPESAALAEPQPQPQPEPELPLIEEPALDEFMAKIDTSAQQLNREKANAFWEDLANGHPVSPQNPDVITFEQAQKLGLAPGEAND